MPSVFTLQGPELGEPVGEDETWFHRHPVVGIMFSFFAPVVLGLGVSVAYTHLTRRDRHADRDTVPSTQA